MCGWPFLWQNVRVVNLSITHDYLFPSLSFNVFRSSGNSNPNSATVTSNFGIGLHQFDCTAAQRGTRKRGRQKKRWEDNIMGWKVIRFGDSLRAAEDREG